MEPDEGTYKWGVTTSQAYFPKDSTREFDNDDTIVEWLTQYSEEKDVTYVRGFLGRMLFAGDDGVKENGDRAYSSYISIAAPFKLGGLDWTAEVGATPWETDFYGASGFAVCDVSLGATKDIRITNSFSLPLFAKATWNPCSERAYFVVGLSF